MRKLLILAAEDLEDPVVRLLRRHDWALVYARSAQDAQALQEQEEFLVGVAVFSGNETVCRECERAVVSLPRTRWVALLQREAVANLSTKRLIAERLHDFQTRPVSPVRLSVVLGHAYGLAQLQRELRALDRPEPGGRYGMIGTSPVMLDLYRVIQRAAATDMYVLITGETGTGKEIAARAIHASSARASGPFVALNCAAVPPSLIQAELFGHERGAFTDAVSRRIGRIEAASGGTLLLDEIGDMPLEAQATLLRVLEEKTVTRIGGRAAHRVDVRVIASTNRDLRGAIEAGHFRLDLFHRLAVLTIRLPELRAREDDIEMLARHFLGLAVRKLQSPIVGFTQSAFTLLRRHKWPGNVRELRSRIFQAVALCDGRYVTAEMLGLAQPGAENAAPTLNEARKDMERDTLISALARSRWNVSQAARNLGISRMTLYRLMQKHGVDRPAGESG